MCNSYEFKWAHSLNQITVVENNPRDAEATRAFTLVITTQGDKGQERRVLAFLKEEDKNTWAEALQKLIEECKAFPEDDIKQPRRPSAGFFRARGSNVPSRVNSGAERPKTIFLGNSDSGNVGPSTPLKDNVSSPPPLLAKIA